jgi:hypothetical protein
MLQTVGSSNMNIYQLQVSISKQEPISKSELTIKCEIGEKISGVLPVSGFSKHASLF